MSYYARGKIQPLDLIEKYNIPFCEGNVIKYLIRAGRKTELPWDDIEKAMTYWKVICKRKTIHRLVLSPQGGEVGVPQPLVVDILEDLWPAGPTTPIEKSCRYVLQEVLYWMFELRADPESITAFFNELWNTHLKMRESLNTPIFAHQPTVPELVQRYSSLARGYFPPKVEVVQATEETDQIQWIQLTEGAVMPQPAHEGDAGWDLFVCCEGNLVLHPGETCVVPTGVRLKLPRGTVGLICSRSGLALKGMVVANAPGIIDRGYTGEIKVIMYNQGKYPEVIQHGTRMAQMVIVQVMTPQMPAESQTPRGDNGFGSSGV